MLRKAYSQLLWDFEQVRDPGCVHPTFVLWNISRFSTAQLCFLSTRCHTPMPCTDLHAHIMWKLLISRASYNSRLFAAASLGLPGSTARSASQSLFVLHLPDVLSKNTFVRVLTNARLLMWQVYFFRRTGLRIEAPADVGRKTEASVDGDHIPHF